MGQGPWGGEQVRTKRCCLSLEVTKKAWSPKELPAALWDPLKAELRMKTQLRAHTPPPGSQASETPEEAPLQERDQQMAPVLPVLCQRWAAPGSFCV